MTSLTNGYFTCVLYRRCSEEVKKSMFKPVNTNVKMTEKQCLNAAVFIALHWKLVAVHLGFNLWEIHAIEQECRGNSILWTATMMLVKWTQREVHNANVANLTTKLKELKIINK